MGKGIVDELRKEFFELCIEEKWLPYEIHPDTPPQGVLLKDYFVGMNPEPFFRELDARGEPMGVRFNFQPLMSNSRLALMAGEYAKEHGKYHEFHEAVFIAYFTNTKDIGDREVILSIGREVGLDESELVETLDAERYLSALVAATADARKLEVKAAPTFFFDCKGRQERITGAQPMETFRQALRKVSGELKTL